MTLGAKFKKPAPLSSSCVNKASITKLVDPKLQEATSPLLITYREKLMIIDSAIAELRASIERNRFNAHLRQELLSIYQEKQRTLQEVMREGRNVSQ